MPPSFEIRSNYSEEFKRYTVNQVVLRGNLVREVSQRFGVSTHPLYKWMKQFAEPASKARSVATCELRFTGFWELI
ncbi:MAG: transposase [Rhodothermales bacterium]|nr:transposase [Rhodothermales bacterium]